MAMVAGVLSLVGGIVSAAGAIEQGNYQAQVANNNAKIAEQNAAYSRQAGREAADIKSREGAAKEAAIVTGLAASNVDISSTGTLGPQTSAEQVKVGQREVSKLDTLTTEHNVGEVPAYGYMSQVPGFLAQAKQDKIGAQYAAFGDILGGIGNFASSASSFGGFGFGGGGSGGGGGSAASIGSVAPTPVSGGIIPLYGDFNLPTGSSGTVGSGI